MKWRLTPEWAILAGAALIAWAILATNHYALATSPNGTLVLDRWYGTVTTCTVGTTAPNGVMIGDCQPGPATQRP